MIDGAIMSEVPQIDKALRASRAAHLKLDIQVGSGLSYYAIMDYR